jgi:hypothetical protein
LSLMRSRKTRIINRFSKPFRPMPYVEATG